MPIQLNEGEMQILADMDAQVLQGQIAYWQIYDWLVDRLLSHGVSATDSTVLWLRGATQANVSRGSKSELIRGYTAHQYQLRYDEEMDPDLLQEASDEIAAAVNDRSYQCAA